MIFEYTDLGDLKNYLLARNPSTDIPSHAGPLTLEQQIDICHQVKSTHMNMYYFKVQRVSKGYKIDGYAYVFYQQVIDWWIPKREFYMFLIRVRLYIWNN